MTHTFAATPARSRTLPRASRAPHSETPLTSTFSEEIQITTACEMVSAGVPLAQIAQVLRHHSLQTTAAYARVDLDRLRLVSTPWPGGAQR